MLPWRALPIALAEQNGVRDDGWDTHLSVVPACNTLGWVVDPVFSPMLKDDVGELASTILHEMSTARSAWRGSRTSTRRSRSGLATRRGRSWSRRPAVHGRDLRATVAFFKTLQGEKDARAAMEDWLALRAAAR